MTETPVPNPKLSLTPAVLWTWLCSVPVSCSFQTPTFCFHYKNSVRCKSSDLHSDLCCAESSWGEGFFPKGCAKSLTRADDLWHEKGIELQIFLTWGTLYSTYMQHFNLHNQLFFSQFKSLKLNSSVWLLPCKNSSLWNTEKLKLCWPE